MSEIYCPICDRLIDWDRTPPYRIGADGRAEPLVRDPRESEASWRDRLITAYRPCSDVGQAGTHLLPYDYADYTPVTIGMIGHSKAGKTHLLAAMISRLCSNDPVLDRIGLRVGPLDLRVHQRYVADCVTPLIMQHKQLEATPGNAGVEFCDALKVTNGRQQVVRRHVLRPGRRAARPQRRRGAILRLGEGPDVRGRPGCLAGADRLSGRR